MRKDIPHIIVYLVFIIVFNVVFFLFKPEEAHAGIWISYTFIHLAYIAVVITQGLDKKNKEVALNLSSYLISLIYFIIEFIIGVTFIIINTTEYKLSIALQLALASIYVVVLITNLIVNKNITNSVESTERARDYVKGVPSVINAILCNKYDERVLKKLKNLYDVIHSSPIRTNSNAAIIEIEIEDRIRNLENIISVMGIDEQIFEIDSLINLANKRNIIVMKDS